MEEDRAITRIFVGGLGENVKEADMEQIFRESLGKIDAIDFVRTKGRCFAYCDFIPSSEKSLSKIFSTYNGCVWKGGKLKLEKAKEHYLVRMEKEWEEEAQLVTAPLIKDIEPIGPLPISKKDPKWEKMQLHIFFPKLQKVKPLPFAGSGKHKYSFQRIEVPPLPINFCDCDEHYVPHTAKAKYVSDSKKESTGITEEELNVMNSVMNKLIYKESNSKAGSDFSEIFKGDAFPARISDDNEATDEEDEDNLIINVVANGSKKNILSGTLEEPKAKQLQFSKDGLLGDAINTKEREVPPHHKKRKIITRSNNNTSDNGGVSRNPKRQDARPRDAMDILPDHEAPPELYRDSKSVPAWSQKSSWKQLVGDEGNSLFSISSVLPGRGGGSGKKGTSDGKYGSKLGQTKEQEGEIAEESQPTLNGATNKEATKTYAASNDNETFGEETVFSNASRDGPAEKIQLPNEVKGEEPQPSNVLKSGHVAKETHPSSTFGNSGRGDAWFHKSSWTQLIGETDNSFSISQIIPFSATSEKDETPKFNEQPTSTPADKNTPEAAKPSIDVVQPTSTPADKNTPEAAKPSIDVVPVKNEHSAPQGTVVDTILPGTCSFIRSAASLKEWANSKAAITRSVKRKTRED